MNYETGTLWNYITQPQAAIVSKNMYSGNSYIESDLINSYAWDTAIVYIQAMGNENYANKIDGSGTLKNTGKTEDEKCKIFDMAGNTREWTTEYTIYADANTTYPCSYRGAGYPYNTHMTSSRSYRNATSSSYYFSFRTILYFK